MTTAMHRLDEPFGLEARVHMDRHDLPLEAYQQVRYAIAHRAYMEEIEPFIKKIVSVKSLAIPTYMRHADGRLEVSGDGLTDEMRKIVSHYQQQIDGIKARYDQLMANGAEQTSN